MRAPLPRWLPVLVLLAGILGSTGLVVVRPGAAPEKPPPPPPAVQVIAAEPGAVQVGVRAQGSLEPRTETDLVAEVGGRVAWIAPALETGARFAAGDELLRIADEDLRIAADRAAAAVDRARHRLQLAEASLERRRSLRDRGAASLAALDEAESTAGVADADLREAIALHRAAERDLERAVLRAPFDGRGRELRTDVGEIAAAGAVLARLFAVDFAEVRLPLPDSELAFLELPRVVDGERRPGSPVRLRGSFAGVERELAGELVGVEGALDPRTRMVTALVRVPRPETDDPGLPALPMGLFVEARFAGRRVEPVVSLPRAALRGRDAVAVVGPDQRLELRHVSVLRVEGERVLVDAGLEAGERVCTSPLDLLVPGMRVRVVPSAPAT